MNKITSVADFFERVKTDDRYKNVAVYAYKDSIGCSTSYETASRWIDGWRSKSGEQTCQTMANYLNDCMNKIPIFKEGLISPHTINTFTEQSQIDR